MSATSPRTRALGTREAVDVVVVAALVVACAVGFGPAFGGTRYLVASGAGLVLGLGLAALGAWRRVRTLGMTALVMVAYLAVGGAVALPATTVAHVVPTLATVRGLLRGAALSWKDVVTAAPPLDSYDGLLIVPFLATLVVTVLAATIALRSSRPAGALLPVAVLFVGVILLGTTQPAVPVVQGVVLALVGLAWVTWRAARDHRPVVGVPGAPQGATMTRRLRGVRAARAAGLLVAAGALTAVLAGASTPATPRVVLRDTVVPPLELHDFASPLVGFRKYVKDDAGTVLFTVTGLPAGQRVRLAVMDDYTGTVYDVAGGQSTGGAGGFTRVGSTLARGSLDGQRAGTVADLTFTVGAYRDVWVPDAGLPSSITFTGSRADVLRSSLHYNPEADTALVTARLAEGDTYQVTTVLPAVPEAGDLTGRAFASPRLPSPRNVPDSVAVTADTFLGGASTPAEEVENLRDALAKGGVLSHGLESDLPSRAGHGANRIDTLLTGDSMVGDDEQFAVAMALMARQLGIPARVVMGFYPKDGAAAGTAFDVHGSDVHAWVEVAFDGLGWVAFDPIPDATTPPQDQDPRSQSEPQPQQLQQPPPPKEPAEPPSEPLPEAAKDEHRAEIGDTWLALAAHVAAVAIPLALLGSPFLLVMAAKTRRRARRRRTGDPASRIVGGWSEVVDTAVDHGFDPPVGATRRETAVAVAVAYPTTAVLTLAGRADAGIFGPEDPAPEEIDGYWSDVDGVLEQISASVGRWRRWRARTSVRSLWFRRTARRGRRTRTVVGSDTMTPVRGSASTPPDLPTRPSEGGQP